MTADGKRERVDLISRERRQLSLGAIGIPTAYQALRAEDYVPDGAIEKVPTMLLTFYYHKDMDKAYAAASCVIENLFDRMMSVAQLGLQSILRYKASGWRDDAVKLNLEKTIVDPQVLSLVSLSVELLERMERRDLDWLFAMLLKRYRLHRPTTIATSVRNNDLRALFTQNQMEDAFNHAFVVKVGKNGSD